MDIAKLNVEGRAYGMEAPTSDPVLTQVGPGTPGGELLRRFWQPIAPSSDATAQPKQIRRFGEDLILFRNKAGEPGLLYPRCAHRGTSLLYGRVEDDGIRCCYHGWKFNNQGVCLEQPCEPNNGGTARAKIRQPWYPVVEEHGAIWTYMGPADKQPLFPIFSIFEDLRDDEEIVAEFVGVDGVFSPFPSEYNWFQNYENVDDQYHLPMLHCLMSGDQFVDARYATIPEVTWEVSPNGSSILTKAKRLLPNGETYCRIDEGLIPNSMVIAPVEGVGPGPDLFVFVPFSDVQHASLQIRRKKKDELNSSLGFAGYGPENKRWVDMSLEEHQRYPGDYEAQGGQGAITYHSQEHLALSDVGISMHRRLFKQQVDRVAKGDDPIGVAFKEADRRIEIQARGWYETAKNPEVVEAV